MATGVAVVAGAVVAAGVGAGVDEVVTGVLSGVAVGVGEDSGLGCCRPEDSVRDFEASPR